MEDFMSVYQIVADRIIEALEKNIVPWKNPYIGISHQNFLSKRPYSGINRMLLNIASTEHEYPSPYWLTWTQISQKGWTLKKGSKSAIVTFWSPIEKVDKETEGSKSEYILRYYKVYNASQVNEISNEEISFIPKIISDDVIFKLLEKYCSLENITIKYAADGTSHYNLVTDSITLAPVEDYAKVITFAHECIHSTGHSKRLNRFKDQKMESEVEKIAEGLKDECVNIPREELTAEIGTIILCDLLNAPYNFTYSASYINNWLKFLRNKKSVIFYASSQAQKAVDYILKVTNVSIAA
jgi:antirestriction protein ArdC